MNAQELTPGTQALISYDALEQVWFFDDVKYAEDQLVVTRVTQPDAWRVEVTGTTSRGDVVTILTTPDDRVEVVA